jgi:hypothetical protein
MWRDLQSLARAIAVAEIRPQTPRTAVAANPPKGAALLKTAAEEVSTCGVAETARMGRRDAARR